MKGFADQSANIAQVVQELGYKGQYLQLGILENFGAYKDTLVEKFPTLFTCGQLRRHSGIPRRYGDR